MPHPSRVALIAAAVVALVVVTPIAWYLGSPVFLRTELQEPPVGAIASVPAPTATPRAAASIAPEGSPGNAEAATPSPGATTEPTEVPWTPAPTRTGQFTGTDEFHFGRGTAILHETEPGHWVVRLEDFAVRNGPDLFVVLSPDAAGYTKDSIEVGRLKATDGNFNMQVPDGTDVSQIKSVLIWCKQFSHLFAVAPLEG